MQTSTPATSIYGGAGRPGLRRTLRRWKDKWRVSSAPASSRQSIISTPTTRPPTNASSITPSPSHLSTIPASPPPPPAALFTPTTETFIHSPADPRNRSNSRSNSSTSSPPGTLKKMRPLERRNTAPTEYMSNASHTYLPSDPAITPLNVVTTTIVAGNDCHKRKRQSRFRLSLSRNGSMFSVPSSPSQPSFFGHERSASRSGRRYEMLEERCSSRAAGRFDAVEEMETETNIGMGRKRADSDRDTLVEEEDIIKRDRVKGLDGSRDSIRVVEVTA